MMANETTDADVIQLLLTREMVRLQAEMLKATGWPPFSIASEMMVQAFLMVIPNVTADDAREAVQGFWKTFLTDYNRKLGENAQAVAHAVAAHKLDGGVLPFVPRWQPKKPPANEDAQGSPPVR